MSQQVADFGLAKLVERTSDEDLIATRFVGTSAYLPPKYSISVNIVLSELPF